MLKPPGRGDNQWVLKPENSLVWHTEVIGFINRHSGVDRSISDGGVATE
jgi:hypothetical protein